MGDFLDSKIVPISAAAIAPPDFISLYLDYTAETECPTFFHRWTALTSLSAYLGRRVHFQHGHFTIHPNIYSMLIGSPGTKKSSAIKIGAKLLKQAGYSTFAARKTRQEKFLLDLAEQAEKYRDPEEDILDANLWGAGAGMGGGYKGEEVEPDASSYESLPPCETFVAADEFNNFIGVGNLEFASILGELWDYEGVYDYRLKNSKSVFIPNPTVTILGGNTPTGFSQAFPTDAIGQGFFSRLLLIYGEPSGVLYTFPPAPNLELQAVLIKYLHRIKETVSGEMSLSPKAKELMDTIYKNDPGIDDLRFEHYANRRLTHLIKLCLVVTASRCSNTIEEQDIIYANTILSFTEQLMPKALGEFGKAKNSDITHKIMNSISAAATPISLQAIWKAVHSDLENRNQLIEIINNLQVAEKVQAAQGGYLPIKKIRKERLKGTVDWNLLTSNERELL